MIKSGELRAVRTQRGKRADIHQIDIESLNDVLDANVAGGRRFRRSDDVAAKLAEIDERIRRLEDLVQVTRAAADVNANFVNLRLLEMQDDYAIFARELIEAEQHRAAALAAIQNVVDRYRAIVEQYNLPGQPPTDR